MKRLARILIAVVVGALAMSMVVASPAHAKESDLRERAHARIAAILDEAVSSGIYSQVQSNYVTSAILPVSVDPRPLSAKVEERTIENFWERIAEVPGVSVAQARSRVANGSTLRFVTGDSSDSVQRAVRNWLAGPAFRTYLDGEITLAEFDGLRGDIDRAVDRLMIQSGGPDGTVNRSPRRL